MQLARYFRIKINLIFGVWYEIFRPGIGPLGPRLIPGHETGVELFRSCVPILTIKYLYEFDCYKTI